MSPYVPLWCKSHYSFLEGASSPQELVDACKSLGIRTLALTDRDGLYGVVRAHFRAAEQGIHLIIGAEITVEDGSTIVLLVKNHEGYKNLCGLISAGRLRSPKGRSSVTWAEVCAHADGLCALWGGPQSALVTTGDPTLIRQLQASFHEDLFAMIVRHRHPTDSANEARTRHLAEHHGLPLVGAQEVLYHSPARRDLQDVLTCIRHRCTIHNAGDRTRPNDEHSLKTPRAWRALFEDAIPLVEATRRIAERCTFSLAELRYTYPVEGAPPGVSPDAWLAQLTLEGAHRRYGAQIPDDVHAQLLKELQLIQELDYGGYFLTMKELVDYCRAHDILCQGRGSAANSAVCYCLGITAVDPVRMGFLFERFLSRERAEPPDIDLDIAHQRREEVIQHMYTRYGRDRAAMVANVIRYRARSAFRDVGTALGFSETALDRASKLLSHYGSIDETSFQQAGFSLEHPLHQHLFRLANELVDTPRHLSIHPGGFLIGSGPIHELVPIENATMEHRTVIQWDKYDVEDLGLFKVDLLGLGALTQIDSAFSLLRQHYAHDYDMATVPADCARTFEAISKGDTIGVFQIESRAQMSMLPRLKPRCFYDIVIQISIVRPGPITGGMVHPYLRRRDGEEAVTYPHPMLRPVLERTLGIPLFQEQVMRLAVVAADYTPGEADQLRRDMGAWKQNGRMELHRERLIRRMVHKGIAQEFAERVFDQIRGFGEYGFPESHAASFALIAWVSAWLRHHYPEAFLCAMLNAQPMGFYSASTLLSDARRLGIEVRPLDVQHSGWDFSLEPRDMASPYGERPRPASAIRMGLRAIRGFREEDAARVVRARNAGLFASLDDVMQRTQLREAAALQLAQAGALDSVQPARRQAIWALRRHTRSDTLPLFPAEEDAYATPHLPALTDVERLAWDHRQTGASAEAHVLEPLRERLTALRLAPADAIMRRPNGSLVHYAGIVICRQRPSTAGGVVFMTLEDETGFINLIIWQKVWEPHAVFLKTHSFIGVSGRLQIQHGATHVIAERFWTPPLHKEVPRVAGRDFH